jgi:hypothetical protein
VFHNLQAVTHFIQGIGVAGEDIAIQTLVGEGIGANPVVIQADGGAVDREL